MSGDDLEMLTALLEALDGPPAAVATGVLVFFGDRLLPEGCQVWRVPLHADGERPITHEYRIWVEPPRAVGGATDA